MFTRFIDYNLGGNSSNDPTVDLIIVEDICPTGPCISDTPRDRNGDYEVALDSNLDGLIDNSLVADGGGYFFDSSHRSFLPRL